MARQSRLALAIGLSLAVAIGLWLALALWLPPIAVEPMRFTLSCIGAASLLGPFVAIEAYLFAVLRDPPAD
ncbi:hypothetical protein [Sphingomonas sp.]|uniref:hypothetical protein n=1 Tax=Sphingomonas sp. TaxID=28214 RepID=UPI002EDA59EF